MEFEYEESFICPYCGQQISMLLETLNGAQSYIEDCETCCSPIQISYEVDEEGKILQVYAERA